MGIISLHLYNKLRLFYNCTEDFDALYEEDKHKNYIIEDIEIPEYYYGVLHFLVSASEKSIYTIQVTSYDKP